MDALRPYQHDALTRILFGRRDRLLDHLHIDTGGGCIFCGLQIVNPPKRNAHLESHMAVRPTLGEALLGKVVHDNGPCPLPWCWISASSALLSALRSAGRAR